MMEGTMSGAGNDDPRKLRTLVARASDLAKSHALSSVLVGLAAPEGDRDFPGFIEFLLSAIRVEDGLFRMTRERAVLHLADLDPKEAREVIDRLIEKFDQESSAVQPASIDIRIFAIKPGTEEPSVKKVLTEIFAPRTLH
jgi:hypothetical protein